MVTVGFIVEGHTEAALIKDEGFINFLASLNIFCSHDLVINAKGKNNLYNPKGNFGEIKADIEGFISKLKNLNAHKIFFLIDFDNDDRCFTQFKSKVFQQEGNFVIIAKQAIEAWFLADHTALSKYLQKRIDPVEFPESFGVPFEEIKSLRLLHASKGIADKKILAKAMLASGFSLPAAAAHPSCPSAAYFLSKLQSVSNQRQS